jgi:hypothetical protein
MSEGDHSVRMTLPEADDNLGPVEVKEVSPECGVMRTLLFNSNRSPAFALYAE